MRHRRWNLSSMVDATGVTSTTFTARNETKAVTVPSSKIATYTYDDAGRRTALGAYGEGNFGYGWDEQGRQTRVTNTASKTATLVYDQLHRVQQRLHANAAFSTQTYDAAGNLKQIIHFGPGSTVLASLSYDYDKTNHRTKQTESDGTITTWTYDNNYQLTNEHRASGPTGTGFNITYTYDDAGNRTVKNTGISITTYTYDNANRLKTETTGTTITTYTNDSAGNRTQKQKGSDVVYYTWDAAGRMVNAEPAAGIVTYTYNADHQRVGKHNTDGSVTGYLFDLNNLLHETEGIGGDVESTFTSTIDDEYGDLLSQDGDGQVYHQYDAQMNVNVATDDTGAVIGQYKYEAFGLGATCAALPDEGWASLTVDDWSNLSVNDWAALPIIAGGNLPGMSGGFAQKQYYLDPETELYILGMGGGTGRPYDPNTGRFVSEDKIRQAGGENLQEYAGNDPVNRNDPNGQGENEAAARGRVVGAAIERQVLAATPGEGNRNQAPVRRNVGGVTQPGKADLQIANKLSEVGPASPTGVSAKNTQMAGVPQKLQDNIYLYDQTKIVPKVGDVIEFAKLTPQQALQLGNEIRSANSPANAQIFARAKEIAGLENCSSVNITEADISQAGRYYNGIRVNALNCIGIISFALAVGQGLDFQKSGTVIETKSREQTLDAFRNEVAKDRPSPPTTIRENEVLMFDDKGGSYFVQHESAGFFGSLVGKGDHLFKVYVRGPIYDLFRFDVTGSSPTRIEVFGAEREALEKQIKDEIQNRQKELERLQRKHPSMPVYLGMDPRA